MYSSRFVRVMREWLFSGWNTVILFTALYTESCIMNTRTVRNTKSRIPDERRICIRVCVRFFPWMNTTCAILRVSVKSTFVLQQRSIGSCMYVASSLSEFLRSECDSIHPNSVRRERVQTFGKSPNCTTQEVIILSESQSCWTIGADNPCGPQRATGESEFSARTYP